MRARHGDRQGARGNRLFGELAAETIMPSQFTHPMAHGSAIRMSLRSKLVFTNGCFDLLHPGHVDLLERARALGDRLVVGLNSDASVRALKGCDRPYMSEADRRRMLLALRWVDEVVLFDDLTPLRLVEELRPNVLVKGGDWPIERIVGADEVWANGGEVHSLPLCEGHSTSQVVERIVKQARARLARALVSRQEAGRGAWRKAS